jgi:hypothetical protein
MVAGFIGKDKETKKVAEWRWRVIYYINPSFLIAPQL